MEKLYIAQPGDAGARLDFFVARCLACGNRAAKRLIENNGVTVNGAVRPAHFKIPAGAEIAIAEAPPAVAPVTLSPADENKDIAVFFKPAGLHTAAIAGSPGPSLEGILAEQGFPVTLLSRLDYATSGLVAAAFTPEAAERFRTLEATGRVRKEYIALVHGVVRAPITVCNALDTANRKITRVLEEISPDATRHTEIVPLPLPPLAENTTLVIARIRRGARHQIRAHLAFSGYPIVGDTLYGDTDSGTFLRLHHARLSMPGFSAFLPPPWLPDFLEHFLEDGPCASPD